MKNKGKFYIKVSDDRSTLIGWAMDTYNVFKKETEAFEKLSDFGQMISSNQAENETEKESVFTYILFCDYTDNQFTLRLIIDSQTVTILGTIGKEESIILKGVIPNDNEFSEFLMLNRDNGNARGNITIEAVCLETGNKKRYQTFGFSREDYLSIDFQKQERKIWA